ncbi:MAG: GTP cyclohydrolase I FolE [Candidatus Omnitrophica bacterium]|nr:GTP cyclohydrolase I FolE [Candidatus Omnitrophota bacterium]
MDKEKIAKGAKLILEGIGTDVKRKDMVNTPQRVADMYEEILAGEHRDPSKELDIFLEQKHDEIILIKDIPLYSLCEHHLLPFVGRAHVAYIPDKQITGLSKIARVVDMLARRLQVQERLTTDIADVIMKRLKPKGVMVVIEAEHLCMTMRGVKKPGATTVTSVVRGVFRSNRKTREETLSLISSR